MQASEQRRGGERSGWIERLLRVAKTLAALSLSAAFLSRSQLFEPRRTRRRRISLDECVGSPVVWCVPVRRVMKRRRREAAPNSSSSNKAEGEAEAEATSELRPRTRRQQQMSTSVSSVVQSAAADAAAPSLDEAVAGGSTRRGRSRSRTAAASEDASNNRAAGDESAEPSASRSSNDEGLLPTARFNPSAPRRSRRLNSELHRLATVEQQLIMQFLDKQSLLSFARCSRWLHSAADADFAWRHVSPTRVSMRLLNESWAQPFASSLLRHAGVYVSWESWYPDSGPDVEMSNLTHIPSGVALRSLVCNRRMDAEQFGRLCGLTPMQSLTDLYLLVHPLPLGFTHLLRQLPALRILTLSGNTLDAEETLDALPLLPRLQRLTLSNLRRSGGGFALQHLNMAPLIHESIGQCRALTYLSLHDSLLDQASFVRMLQSATLAASLAHLHLPNVRLADRSAATLTLDSLAALSAAFSNLTSLRQLTFLAPHIAIADLLLNIVRALPQLQKLYVRSNSHLAQLKAGQVEQLLHAAPSAMHLIYGPVADRDLPSTQAEYDALLTRDEYRARLTFTR